MHLALQVRLSQAHRPRLSTKHVETLSSGQTHVPLSMSLNQNMPTTSGQQAGHPGASGPSSVTSRVTHSPARRQGEYSSVLQAKGLKCVDVRWADAEADVRAAPVAACHPHLEQQSRRYHSSLKTNVHVHFRGRARDAAGCPHGGPSSVPWGVTVTCLPRLLLPPQASRCQRNDTGGPLQPHTTDKNLSIFNLGNVLGDGVGTRR